MIAYQYVWSTAMACALVATSTSAAAQDSGTTGNAPPPDPALIETPASGGEAQIYTSADFVRYAPRNALDMLSQVPGFNIRDSEQRRGLGTATGNVLFNGVRPSNKSEELFTLLQRIPADTVDRIEIVDGATLDIPGLSGQVANIVYRANDLSGQFAWNPEFRTNFTDPLLTRGTVSLSGRAGTVEYQLGLNNENSGRSGAGGATLVYDGNDTLIETRDEVFTSDYDSPRLSASINWDPVGSVEANLNSQYQRIYNRYREDGTRTFVGGIDQARSVRQNGDSWNWQLGGDIAFDLGPGRLKSIGLRRFSREPFAQTVITEFADASPTLGNRFTQSGDIGETIGRGEYSWGMFGGDWQLAGEAAFNTLENVAELFLLDADGNFIEVPFPGGSGGVSEDRYEGSLSFGRPITSNLSFQLIAGAEHSTIMQTGDGGLTRSFLRPKGSLSLAWQPGDGFDASVRLSRRVGQLSFYDFLARAFLDDDNQNAGNADLRPQQDWSVEGELGKTLGPWGSTRFRFIYRDVEDRVDIVPVGTSEAVGNIPSAWAAAVVSESSINLDPLGVQGMRLDATIVFQTSRQNDPFTNEDRQWSGFPTRQASFNLRHDIPASDWAYSLSASHAYVQPRYRSNEVSRTTEGPWFASASVENKDVFGLTVAAGLGNILGARSYRDRTVFEGLRGTTLIDFVERRNRLIGPIFSLSVRGDF
ncbi:TonB-dependent receptor plug domain-containing protein [Sphingomicrobium sp. XHP0239]|uniref:TonB-dependent receptor plug domain-containing protein n=1 Tax=Sphingomicrobium maritimum TaxID=3133972 RepID=UPI0031CCC9F4